MNSFNLAFVSAFATLRSGALPDIQASNILYLIVSRGRSGCGKRLFRRRRSPRPSSGMQTSICTISLTQCEVAHSQDDEHINASAAASLRAAHLGRGARGWPFKSILWPGLSSGRSRQRIPPCSSTSSAKEDNKMSACTTPPAPHPGQAAAEVAPRARSRCRHVATQGQQSCSQGEETDEPSGGSLIDV